MSAFYARIRPYNPKRGATAQSYTFKGVRYLEEKGWYEIDNRDLAIYLSRVTLSSDPDGPRVFEVITEKQANKMLSNEQAESSLGSLRRPQGGDLTAPEVRASQPQDDFDSAFDPDSDEDNLDDEVDDAPEAATEAPAELPSRPPAASLASKLNRTTAPEAQPADEPADKPARATKPAVEAAIPGAPKMSPAGAGKKKGLKRDEG